jgi:hypothetical protein
MVNGGSGLEKQVASVVQALRKRAHQDGARASQALAKATGRSSRSATTVPGALPGRLPRS